MSLVKIIDGQDFNIPNFKIHTDKTFNLLKVFYWIDELNDWFPLDLSAQNLKSAYAKKYAEKIIEDYLLDEERIKNVQYLEAY